MDPFEDFEEILVQSRLKSANSQPKSRLERQNRPRTASLRISSETAAVTISSQQTSKVESAGTKPQTRSTVSNRQNLKPVNDTSNLYLATEIEQKLRSKAGVSSRKEVREDEDETRSRTTSGKIENTARPSYSTTKLGSKQLEKVEQLETVSEVSEVSEELSVEWQEEQSGEKLSSGNNLPNVVGKSEAVINTGIGNKSGTGTGVNAQLSDSEAEEEEALESRDDRREIGAEWEDGRGERVREKGEVLELEDLVNLVSDFESSRSELAQTDGELSEAESKSSGDRGENDYIGPDMKKEKDWRIEEPMGSKFSRENEIKRRNQGENALKLVENKLEGKLDSFADNLIGFLQDQFTLLTVSISQHNERIESSLAIQKLSQNQELNGETTKTHVFQSNRQAGSNKSGGNGEFFEEEETKCNPVDDEKLKIVQRSSSKLPDENHHQNDQGSERGVKKHLESGSKRARIQEVIEYELEKENENEFQSLLEYYKRRLRQYNGIISINAICPKLAELSCSQLRRESKKVEMQTGIGGRWCGKQYESPDTCYRTTNFEFSANSLLAESRFASRQLESRRILLLNSIRQTPAWPSTTYLQLARQQSAATLD